MSVDPSGGGRDRTDASSLSALLTPRSIAVVGASPSPGKAGNALMHALECFHGEVYPVHPTATEVLGRRCFRSVSEIGSDLDLAMLAIGARDTAAALEQCGNAGVRAAVVFAGGFAETQDGGDLQEELAEIARANGIRLLGPNTSGFVCPADGLYATFATSAAELSSGPASIVARSGGVNLAASFLLSNSGLGVRFGVGLGNSADVDVVDVLEFLEDDDATKAIGLHLEGIADGRALYDAVARVAARKPLVALKVGRADVGAFAKSHTGALLGDFEVARSALVQAGAFVVDTLDELVDALRVLSSHRLPPNERAGVAVVTAQAGPGLIMADMLCSRDVSLPTLEPATTETVDRLLQGMTWTGNPVDTGRPSETFPEVVSAVAADANVDVIAVYALDEPAALDPASALDRSGVLGQIPVVFATAGSSQALANVESRLAARSVPLFAEPARAAGAVVALVADARARWRRAAAPDSRGPRVDHPVIERTLAEDAVKDLLDRCGFRTTRRVVCDTHDEALAAFHAVGAPVVVKVLNEEILHKTEVGGVHLGIRGVPQVTAALAAIDAIPVGAPSRYLVESQVTRGPELLVGAVRDLSYGPIITLGLGGVDVELIHRYVSRLVPISIVDATEMIDALPPALLAGHRGAAPLDHDELVRLLLLVSGLMESSPALNEIDLNPVRIVNGALAILDAAVACG